MHSIPTLTIATTYQAQSDLRLPHYLGDLWRRSFGAALRSAVCVSPEADCEVCPVQECPFDRLFNHSKTTGRGEPSPWRPLVIHSAWAHPSKHCAKGDELGFSLTLFDRTLIDNPSFLETSLRLLGERGISRRLSPLALRSIDILSPSGAIIGEFNQVRSLPAGLRSATIPWPSEPSEFRDIVNSVEIRFLSPTRLERSGRPLDAELPFHDLADFLLFRWRDAIRAVEPHHVPVFPSLRSLCRNGAHAAHSEDKPMAFAEQRQIVRDAARSVYRIRDRLRWVTYRSYSSRRGKPHSLSGLMGIVRYAEVPGCFLDLLRFGVLTHVGKSCVAGNGAYELRVNDAHWCPPFWNPSRESMS